MSKLFDRLSDPAKSGVYRTSHDRDIRDALSTGAHDVATVELAPGKEAILASISDSLGFPEWFGGNWDALEDCLTDLSWRKGDAHVLLLYYPPAGDDFGVLLDVLASAAEFWRERGRVFFAIVVDPAAKLSLPVLYREKGA